MRHLSVVVILYLLGASSAMSATPQMINYQGRLTDPANNSVPDGNYSVVFTIYDAASGGTSVWTETQNVTTTNGLFVVMLGSSSPILDTVFNGSTRYLGISVAGDPELTPRSVLVSVPYAQRVNTVDGASGGSIKGDFAINLADSITENYKAWYYAPNDVQIYDYFRHGTRRIQLSTQAEGPGIFFIDSTLSWKVGMFQLYDQLGNPYGALHLLGDSAFLQVGSSGLPASLSSSTLSLSRKDSRIDIGRGEIVLDAGTTGDNSVLFPDNALAAHEILDEPGIVANQSTDTDILPSETFQLIDSVVMTTPSSGYIMVQVTGSQLSMGTTGRSFALYQISESLSRRDEAGHMMTIGSDVSLRDKGLSCQSVVDRRIFFKPAGEHAFYFEGRAVTNNATSSIIRISDVTLVAMYFPTSYGSVGSLVANPGNFKHAKAVSITDELTNKTATVYKVDLSELEARAIEAESKARKAIRDAKRASQKLERARRETRVPKPITNNQK